MLHPMSNGCMRSLPWLATASHHSSPSACLYLTTVHFSRETRLVPGPDAIGFRVANHRNGDSTSKWKLRLSASQDRSFLGDPGTVIGCYPSISCGAPPWRSFRKLRTDPRNCCAKIITPTPSAAMRLASVKIVVGSAMTSTPVRDVNIPCG
jgi:hypothetical protein